MRANVSLLAFCFAVCLTGCPLPTGEVTSYATDAPELANASVSAEGVWESAPWLGTPWIPFDGRLTVELEHTLGRTPRGVLVYLAIDENGTDPALAAGDHARIVDANETFIAVRNDTNAMFFVRVVAF
jgi:hypothetical protein